MFYAFNFLISILNSFHLFQNMHLFFCDTFSNLLCLNRQSSNNDLKIHKKHIECVVFIITKYLILL